MVGMTACNNVLSSRYPIFAASTDQFILMLEFVNTTLHSLAIHWVGNKANDDNFLATDNLFDTKNLDTDTATTLQHFFLKPFADTPAFNFSHPVELKMNEVNTITKDIFDNPDSLGEKSQQLAALLYEASTHPKIKAGEFYVVLFKDILFENKPVDALGIFKSEGYDRYLDVEVEQRKAALAVKSGINTKQPDKGCLILNSNEDAGYIVYLAYGGSKGDEALYWKRDFLQLRPQNDNYHHTANLLQLTKQFVMTSLPESGEVSRTEQIDLLQRSVSYFKENEQFDIKDFEKTVFRDEDTIEQYREFGSRYITQHDLHIAGNFDVSLPALKKQARIFKSVIKLDRNFHIYVHGNPELIEQGIDETGRKYYKLYFKEEH